MEDSSFAAAVELALGNGWICEIDEDEDEVEGDHAFEVVPTEGAPAAWIPVTETMPPDLPEFRIIVSDGQHSESAYSGTLYRNPEGVLIAPARYGWGIEVLWWMPWPSLPVADREGKGEAR
jgi:hypothetical protein